MVFKDISATYRIDPPAGIAGNFGEAENWPFYKDEQDAQDVTRRGQDDHGIQLQLVAASFWQ